MKVIPAVDILNGRCVQLVGGRLGTEKVYGDPVNVSLDWIKKGARMLHIIDLDAALGRGDNFPVIKSIRSKTSASMFVGGGVRSMEKIDEFVHLGVDKIILGTVAVEDIPKGSEFLQRVSNLYGKEKIVAAVDSKGGYVVTKGWGEKSKIKTLDALKAFEPYCWGFLYTDVDVEGKMKGSRIKKTENVVKSTTLPVIASGGISSEKEIIQLKNIGVWGVILGKALYEKKIKYNVLGEYK